MEGVVKRAPQEGAFHTPTTVSLVVWLLLSPLLLSAAVAAGTRKGSPVLLGTRPPPPYPPFIPNEKHLAGVAIANPPTLDNIDVRMSK